MSKEILANGDRVLNIEWGGTPITVIRKADDPLPDNVLLVGGEKVNLQPGKSGKGESKAK